MLIKELLEIKNTKLINGNENDKINYYSISTKDIKKNTLFIPLMGKTDGHNYIIDGVNNGISGFVVTKNHSDIIKKALEINKKLIIIEVHNSLTFLHDLATKIRQNIDIPVIALTGSYGKTSQREMILSVLNENFKVLSTQNNFNNEIGMPLTLANYNNEDIILLELGTNHMGEIAFLRDICKPNITLITNIGSAHIGNFKNLRNTFKEKTSITKGSKYFFRNMDDIMLKKYKPKNMEIISYSILDENITNIIYGNKNRYTVKIDQDSYKVTINSDIKYLINYSIAAMKIGLLLGMPIKDIIKGISKFKVTSGRMDKITNGKYILINDCYNASFETMINGLNYFNNSAYPSKIVILGDILELGKKSHKIHKEIAKYIIKNKLNFKEIHLVGKYMLNTYKMLKYKGFTVFHYKTIDEVNPKIIKNNSVYLKASNGIQLYKLIPKEKTSI